MKGVCLRYASCEDDAEDMLQESFIRIFKSLDNYKATAAFGAWVRRITVNTAIELLRKKKIRSIHETQAEIEGGNKVVEQMKTMELEDVLRKIQQLPDGYRMIFNLYCIEGYNHREISELLSISEGTSKSQLARAKKLLQRMIAEENEYELNQLNYGG